MKSYEKELIEAFTLNKIELEEFQAQFRHSKENYKSFLIDALVEAHNHRSADDIEDLVTLGFKLRLYDIDFSAIFIKLLEADWHIMHESIVPAIDELRCSDFINVLFITAQMKFKYLEYCNSESLSYKCIWALGNIGNEEALEKLKILSECKDVFIKTKSFEQINRLGKRANNNG